MTGAPENRYPWWVCIQLQLARSIERADLHKVDQDQVDTISKVVDPGKFKDEQKWSE